MLKIKAFLVKYWPVIVITLLQIFLFAANYTPKTYLVGWDNLFPEFDIQLNIKRALFAPWQEYRGLGLEDGMSHAANLPHYLFMGLLSLVLPQNLLRYVYIFLMHFLGGLGIYFLLTNLFHKITKLNSYLIQSLGLVSALFYQYNFATVQMFYLPFEPFAAHFGFLPWLILLITLILEKITKKRVLLFALISLLSTPQAHVPTVFLVYLMLVAIILFTKLVTSRLKSAKGAIVIVLITFFVNAYWGLPFALSAYKNADTITNSKNNQMANEDIFLKNQKYGDLKDTALLRSFSLDYVQYDHISQEKGYMLAPWKSYINYPIINILQWCFFILIIIGLVYCIVKKYLSLFPFILIYVFCFTIVGNDIPLISVFSGFLRDYIPYFGNVFRFVFTKFFVALTFSYSIFLPIGILAVWELIFRNTKKNSLTVVGIVFSALILINSLPSFTGNLLHRQLRVEIPKEYFDVFSFFKNQPKDTRIAVFPLPWYWSWTQYNWGVIGSGFQWFGIEQPTLDLAFTPWSSSNENFYWEASQALYTSNLSNLKTVLQKYRITWLLIDNNIIVLDRAAGSIDIKRLEKSITGDPDLRVAGKLGHITLIKFDQNNSHAVELSSGLPNIGPQYKYSDTDFAFKKTENYLTDNLNPYDVYYPFRNLFTGRSPKEQVFTVKTDDQSISLVNSLPPNFKNFQLVIPPFNPDSLINFEKDDFKNLKKLYPDIYINNQLVYEGEKNSTDSSILTFNSGVLSKIEIRFPKIWGYYSYNSDPWNDFDQEKKPCNVFHQGFYDRKILYDQNQKILQMESIDANNCVNFPFDSLPQSLSYLLTINSRNISGKPLFVSLTNMETKKTYLENYLDTNNDNFSDTYFIIPPMEPSSLGHSLGIDNVSFGRNKTVNELKRITINQIPYDFISKLVFKKPNYENITNTSSINLSISHPNPSYYKINLEPGTENQELCSNETMKQCNNETLILNQAYNDGWKAYEINNNNPIIQFSNNLIKTWLFESFPFIFGKEINPPADGHVLVNNWANGWQLDLPALNLCNNETMKQCNNEIVLFFLPQLLEYLGFLLLPLPLIFLIFIKSNSTSR